MNNVQSSDEIDLIQLIQTVWDGKWKISAITAGIAVCVFGFQISGPAPSFVATTEIKPIIAADAEDYRQSNALGFFAIYRNIEAKKQAQMSTIDLDRDRDRSRDIDIDIDLDRNRNRNRNKKEIPSAVLDQQFIEQLGSRPLAASILRKHSLVVRDEFDSDREYERALAKLVAKIVILPPVNEDGTQRGESRPHWTLRFEFNDEAQWLAALAEFKEIANNNVRNAVKSHFKNLQASTKQKRSFDMEDLDTQISILKAVFDSETASRLAHLEEQAAIARKLGIAKQTSLPNPSIYQSLNTKDSDRIGNITNNMKTDTPLYIRGYDALEKEIELITLRKDKRLFIEGLPLLEQKKLAIMKSQTPERAERLFASTPIMSSVDFQAASFDVNATEFEYESNRKLILALAVVVGCMIGVIYVLTANAMRGRRDAKAGQD